MSSSISFWSQDQTYWQNAATLNTQLSAANASAEKMFSASTASTTAPATLLSAATSSSTPVINSFGQIYLNSALGAATLAAQEGNDRINKQTADINTATVAPGGNLSDQVTFDGSLGVDFGPSGPAMGGLPRMPAVDDLNWGGQLARAASNRSRAILATHL